jgi:hypothetical protein
MALAMQWFGYIPFYKRGENMKQKVMLAMAIIMVLGSVKAMASSAQGSIDPVEMENIQGKWDASELNVNLAKVQSQIKEMNDLRDSISEVEDTNGIGPGIGQVVTVAAEEAEEIYKSSDLMKSRELVKAMDNHLKLFKSQMAGIR